MPYFCRLNDKFILHEQETFSIYISRFFGFHDDLSEGRMDNSTARPEDMRSAGTGESKSGKAGYAKAATAVDGCRLFLAVAIRPW